ncbi:MAG: LysR family transcriptional regulator [Massilia sp.]
MKIENIDDLRVIVQAARTGSLTAAARALGVTPAAASATLKRLESQMGTRLFERSTRALRLTQQGSIMVDYAQRALDLIAEGELQATEGNVELRGTVRVSAPSDLTRTTLLPMFDDFLALHPGVHLALGVSDQPRDVVRDEVDLAIRYGELADSQLTARVLALARPIVAASPAYLEKHGTPQTPQQLLDHNCLTFNRGGRRYRLWRFARNGKWVEVRVEGDRSADDASLVSAWTVAGHGITLRSDIDLRADIASGRLVRILADWETEPYPLHALMPSARFVPQRVRALVDFLAARFKEDLP